MKFVEQFYLTVVVLQSLGVAASVPAVWLLFTLLVLLSYLLSRCCDKQLRQGRSLYCHRWVLGVTAFICRYSRSFALRFPLLYPHYAIFTFLISVLLQQLVFTEMTMSTMLLYVSALRYAQFSTILMLSEIMYEIFSFFLSVGHNFHL